jgi:hypothetical protein
MIIVCIRKGWRIRLIRLSSSSNSSSSSSVHRVFSFKNGLELLTGNLGLVVVVEVFIGIGRVHLIKLFDELFW